jgi:tetratricopeptide (TPR) repeat protein
VSAGSTWGIRVEERRDEFAGTQYAIAKELDPSDPTPWFYDAIRKQLDNRPIEALRDLERSIELNDNRAPFRSRLLLDEDAATRGASLARIYDDLDFQQLGVNEAAKSLALDPGNASAHRFLSDLYLGAPRL